jgi:hypothetical protein
MTPKDIWKKVQAAIGTIQDGIPGPKDEAALLKAKEAALEEHRNPVTAGIYRTNWKGFTPVDDDKLKAILPNQAKHLAQSFVHHAAEYGLHPLFLAAISRHETGNWTSNAFKNKGNAMGISNAHGVIRVESHDESIRQMARSLTREGGYYSKCKTLADVGRVYAPVGAGNDPLALNGHWIGLVAKYMDEYEHKIQ